MLTFPQWQDTRRVDNVTIPILNFHPRYRARNPNARPDLKIFDPLVQGYAAAPTELDRVIILGDILDLAAAFLANNAGGAQRYLTAVQTLQTAANQDLTQKFPTTANAIRQDIIAAANGQALGQKTIRINVYYIDVVGANPNLVPIDVIVNQQITTANTSPAFQAAHLTITRLNANATLITETAAHESLLLTNPPAPPTMAGKFQDSTTGGDRLMTLLNANGGAGVDVVFLQEYDQNDIQGRAFRVGQAYNGVSCNRPIVTMRTTPAVGGGATHATTLLHEICHAIAGNGDHVTDPSNLMASGGIRNGRNELASGQIGWYRNNPWVI